MNVCKVVVLDGTAAQRDISRSEMDNIQNTKYGYNFEYWPVLSVRRSHLFIIHAFQKQQRVTFSCESVRFVLAIHLFNTMPLTKGLLLMRMCL